MAISPASRLYNVLWDKIFEDHFSEDLEKYRSVCKAARASVDRVAASHLAAARTLPMVDHIVRHSDRFQSPALSNTGRLVRIKFILKKIHAAIPFSERDSVHQMPLLQRIGAYAGTHNQLSALIVKTILTYSYKHRDEGLALSFNLGLALELSFKGFIDRVRPWSDKVTAQMQAQIDKEEDSLPTDPNQLWPLLQSSPNLNRLCTLSKDFHPDRSIEEKLGILKQRFADRSSERLTCLDPWDLLKYAIQFDEPALFNSIDLRLVGQPDELCILAAKLGRANFAIKLLPHISGEKLSTEVFPKILLFNSSLEISALRTGGKSLVDDTTYPSNRSPKEQEEIIQGRAAILDHLLNPDFKRPIDASKAVCQLAFNNCTDVLERLFQSNLPYHADHMPDEKYVGDNQKPGLHRAFFEACGPKNLPALQLLLKYGKSPKRREILESTRNFLLGLSLSYRCVDNHRPEDEQQFCRAELVKLLKGKYLYSGAPHALTDPLTDPSPESLEALNRALQEEFDIPPVSIPEYTPSEGSTHL